MMADDGGSGMGSGKKSLAGLKNTVGATSDVSQHHPNI